MKKIFRLCYHFLIILGLTIISQIGGLIWMINLFIFSYFFKRENKFTRLLSFLLLYLVSSFLIVPKLAKLSGRVALPISKSGILIPHNFITPALNRHYVKPKLKSELLEISRSLQQVSPLIKLSYLDANFPFLDGFPLLPHKIPITS